MTKLSKNTNKLLQLAIKALEFIKNRNKYVYDETVFAIEPVWNNCACKFHCSIVGAMCIFVFQRPYGIVGMEDLNKHNCNQMYALIDLCNGKIGSGLKKLGMPNNYKDVENKVFKTVEGRIEFIKKIIGKLNGK